MSNTRLPTDNVDPLIPLSDGHWVNERVANLVDAIREYHSQLDVMWNPNHPPDEPEFKIIETTPTGRFVVMTIPDQEHFDGDVLTRIILGDTSRHDVLNEIDARQKAAMLLAGKEVQERQEYIKDVTKHVLKSPLNKYVVDKNTVIRDHGNRTR
jgi:hypothetical protein